MKATLPRMPRKTKAGLKQQAYDLLGIDEADVLVEVKIEPMLKRTGMLEKVWDYLETSGDDMARLLIAQKYKLANKSQRLALPFEAFCVAASLDPKKVLGLIVAEVYSQNQQAAELMAAAAQPEVVQATIDRAKLGNTREIEMLHKHSRFVPVPSNNVTFVNKANKVIRGNDNSQNVMALPPIEKTVRDLSDRFNDRLLTAPVQEDASLDIEYEDAEDDDEDPIT